MNSGAVTIVYDGDGNRVAKTVGGVTTQYLVDDLNPTGYAQVVEESSAARSRGNTPTACSASAKPDRQQRLDAELLRLRRRRQRAPTHQLPQARSPTPTSTTPSATSQPNRVDAKQLPLSRRTIRLRPRPLLPPRQILQPAHRRFLSRDPEDGKAYRAQDAA
jgi:hypothetical protein